MVNSLNGITAADYQTYLNVQNAMQQTGATNPVSLTYENDSVSLSSNKCTDGKDDGKIGFFSAVGNAVEGAIKGIGNGIKGMFFDENGNFSLKNTLKSAVTIGACFIPIAGPYIAAGLCAVGAVKGGAGMIKSMYNAATATTDAEAKQAFESLGGTTLATGLSVAGLKGSAGAIAQQTGFASTKAMLNNATTSAGRAEIASKVGNSFRNYYGNAWSNGVASASGATSLSKALSGTKAVIKQGAKGTAENAISTAKAIKQQATKTADKLTGKTGTGNAEQIANSLSTKNSKITAKQVQEALNNGGKLTVGDKTDKLSQVGDDISYSLQKVKTKTTTWESTKGSTNTVENLRPKDFRQYTKDFQSGDLTSIKNLQTNQSVTLKNGQVVTKCADGTYTMTTNTNPTLTKTTVYENVTPEQINSFKYKQMIKHNNGSVTYNNNTLTFKSNAPTSVAKLNEFINGDVSATTQLNNLLKSNNAPQNITSYLDANPGLTTAQIKNYVNGINPATEINYNPIIAQSQKEME